MKPDFQPLRELLQCFFGDFLDLVDPGLRRREGLEVVAFLDNDRLVDWPEAERRRLGLVADAHASGGRRLTLLVQIEPRVGHRAALEKRLLRYYLWLLVGRRRPVHMIVLFLHGGRPGVRSEAIVERRGDEEMLRVPYLAFGLEGCRAEEYLARPEPPAWALAAFMRPGRMSRAELRLACLRRIAAAAQTGRPGGLTCG